MHGDPGRGPAVNRVHNNNNMLPPSPRTRNMHAGNPLVGTVYIPREDDNMSQLSMILNFQLHTRNNQNSYFGNEDDQYPPGLSESVMYGDDHTLSEYTRPDGRYGGDEYLYEN